MATRIIRANDPNAWRNLIDDKRRQIAVAATAALRETANNVVREGRSNIQASGRFGPKWVQGLRARFVGIKKGGVPSLDAKAIIYHSFGIAGVFEYGATIQGKPLLWIPTALGGPPPKRSGKKLTYANVSGTPLLFDANDPDKHRKPLYIGIPTARIAKRWHITDIARKYAAKLSETFRRLLKD